MTVAVGVGGCGYLVNQTGGDHATTDPPVDSQTSGSTLVVFAGVYSVASESAAPTDNKSNTYSQHGSVLTYPGFPQSGTFCWKKELGAGGSAHTWTKSCGLGSEVTVIAAEVIGGAVVSSLVDKTHAAAGLNGTFVSDAIVVGEEAVLICALFGEGYFDSDPSAPGWTMLGNYNATTNSIQGSIFAKRVTVAGSYTCTINTVGISQAALLRMVAVTAAPAVPIAAPWYMM